jgi:NADH-quinone oxidoreductase subunit H
MIEIVVYNIICLTIIKLICLLIAIAFFTIAERKAMAAIQRRRGPNVVGLWGLLQPLADGLKLLGKKLVLPSRADLNLFLFAPVLILTLSLISWNLVPFGVGNLDVKYWNIQFLVEYFVVLGKTDWTEIACYIEETNKGVAQIHYTILFLLGLSSLNVYAIIIAGWSSNSKYAFLGSLRSAAQMISYEVSIGLVLLPIVLLSKTFNLTDIVLCQERFGWFCLPLLPLTIIFFVSMLAETNRTPFDLPEAEAELVAGYNVEYSSLIFSMFFLGEYSNMLLMSTLISIFFFGGWLLPFGFVVSSSMGQAFVLALKTTIFCFFYIVVRATLPRYKFNQLMDIGWKIFLPICLSYFLCLVTVLGAY